MMELLMKLFKFVKPKTEIELRDEYFSKAKSHADLERRMKVWENDNLRGCGVIVYVMVMNYRLYRQIIEYFWYTNKLKIGAFLPQLHN